MNLNRTIRFWRGLFFRNQDEIYIGFILTLLFVSLWAVVAAESLCR